MTEAARLVCAALSLVLVAACGARSKTPGGEREIDRLRKQAAKEPANAELWSRLLEHESFGDGGDAEAARRTLARVKEQGSKSLRTRFVQAEIDVLEGRPSSALDAYLEMLKLASTSTDPLAQSLSEASLTSVIDMNDATDDYRTRVDRTFDTLANAPAKLGLNAAHRLRMQRLVRSLSRGDLATARKEAELAGCVQRAEVAGPFGPRELLGFDRTMPGENAGPLAEEHDLGPGRGKAKKRLLETNRCVFGLGRGAHDARPGTSLLRAELQAQEAGDYALRIESPNSVVIWIDGRELWRFDARTQLSHGVQYVPLNLTAGKHELRAKVSSRHPNPALSLSWTAASREAVAGATVPQAEGPLERYVAAKLLLARGDAVSARELMRNAQGHDPSAAALVLQAATTLADPLRSPELRRDHARDLLGKAQGRNAQAWYPAVGLASLAAADGRLKEAIDGLRSALTRWPEVIAIRTALIEQLRARGWVEESDSLVTELAARMPHACAVTSLRLQSAQARGRMAELQPLTETLMTCDATSTARLSLLRAERRYEHAARELLRLRSLGDVLDEAQRIDADLEVAQLVHDAAKIAALRAERSAYWPDRPEPVTDRTDVLLSGGDAKGALNYLTSAIEREPDDLFEVRRLHDALGGESLFADYRKDGAAAISRFEASNRKYSEPQVLVLDYTVVRVFEDGSSADLTHNIMRVQSQEAVDENGEFEIPDGARLLKLHTIKADGTKLEPDVISGKSTLSLPNLSPGDYVEFEFMRGESPSTGFPGGYLGDRFFFRSFEVPFDRSELVVILPPSMTPVLDPRGPAPKTQTETRQGNTVLRWVADESRPLTAEPMSVASREFLPSINLGVRVAWPTYVESLRDLLTDKGPADPAAQQLVATLLAKLGSAPASQRASRLFRWVTDQIEASQNVFGLAPSMLAARTGSRERVLSYLLTLAGIPNELALVRGADGDHSLALLPDPDTFGHLLLRVQTEQGPVWVHTDARHAPFGFVPAHLRGEQALMLNPAAERTETPRTPIESDRRELNLHISLAKNGSASVRVRETLHGALGVSWRNDLDGVPEAQLQARFEESYVARTLPGAQLKRLSIEGRVDPSVPLVLDFEFTVEELGQRVGDEQRIGGLFLSILAPTLARNATRSVTELVGASFATDLRLEFELPEGARVASLPASIKLAYQKLASFSQQAKQDPKQVIVTRSLRVPIMRVSAEAYATFSTFCRNVDLAETSELSIRMP